MNKVKRALSLFMVLLMAVGLLFTTGCSKEEGPADKLVVTVGDNKIYLSEMMYYIYAMELEGDYYNQMYQAYGTNYWDMEYTEGIPMRDMIKQYVMDTAILYEILYDKAVAAGETLTAEEETTIKTNAEQVLTELTDEQQIITGLDNDILLELQEKLVLGQKYYEKLVVAYDIDEQAIQDGINYDEYRQCNTEFLFIPTISYDEEYNEVALTEDEKATAYSSMTAALEKVKAGEEFATVAEGDETLTNSTSNFIYGDTTVESAYQEAAISLENNEIASDIIETESGYYIIKMNNNNSSESYDTAVTNAISEAENDAFAAEYEVIKEDYPTTINTEVWDTIIMGETVIQSADES
ncbi:MAG: putative rane protein [Lachnospiraceae bacterium]|nr:putative rane protein [Lachnospiraceae bacterium]